MARKSATSLRIIHWHHERVVTVSGRLVISAFRQRFTGAHHMSSSSGNILAQQQLHRPPPSTTMSDSPKTDILVLGATGFTGSLISKYLATHPQRKHFSFSVGARSLKKLEGVVTKLDLPSSIKLVQVDVTNNEELERAVKGTRVVINTVGPYWTWGTPVVRCVFCIVPWQLN